MLLKKLIAEIVGTSWLVFGGCGSAVFAAYYLGGSPTPVQLGIGFVGVSLAFGLTVLTMAYAIGHISGCHLNPAVTVGLTVAGRFPAAEAIPYIIAQTIGGLLGAAMIYLIAIGNKDFTIGTGAGTFATNGFGLGSPTGYSMVSCLAAEVILTAFFLFIILGATDKNAPAGFAPIPIGLGLTLIHLIGIPMTNLSVNPARSTGPAVLVAGVGNHTLPVEQLWLFWVAPILGAAIAALVYKLISSSSTK